MARSAARSPVKRSPWPYLSLIPMGLGAWAPIYAGLKAHRIRWVVLGAVWTVAALAGWVIAIATNGGGAGGGLIIFGWVAAFVHSFAIRREYDEAVAGGASDPDAFAAAEAGAERRIADREQARRLADESPELAREMGVGRPDLPGAHDFGLIDVNNAPLSALRRLPGVDAALAAEIDDARVRVRGFSSLGDMGSAMDLDGALVDGLRARAVFLPRPGAA